MLAEDLKPPKRARNPPHNWVEQKEKKKRERKGIKMGPALLRGSCERGRRWGDHLRWRDLKASEKRATAGMRREKQREVYRQLVPCPRTA